MKARRTLTARSREVRAEPLEALEARLLHRFSDRALLKRALTHSSVAATGEGRRNSYERLEFLGDRVLGLVIADRLVGQFPDASEGELSRRLARLVNRDACASAARVLGLGPHLILGDDALRVQQRAAIGMLADACEAVIGALYRDGGLEAAGRMIDHYWGERLRSVEGPERDAKTELQEWAHRKGLGTPVYAEIGREGPDHAPRFEIEVSVGHQAPARGDGASKRDAEHAAATAMLVREGVWSGKPPTPAD